jgi:sugar phosphate isomerase/epimerase
MQIGEDGGFHLTYCTKIHPGHGWEELFGNLRAYVPRLKARLSPDRPFGLGLRLSAVESEELLMRDRLPRFQEFLAQNDVYVFTLNGFPYGSFHGPRVKAEVFAPDWREEARVRYTLRLVEILRRLLPAGGEGSLSTLPLSYKPWMASNTDGALRRISGNLAEVAARLAAIRKEEGKLIHLDLEPEPDGWLETSGEVVDFFKVWLLPVGGPALARAAGMSLSECREALLTHIQVCLDTCHQAVEYEDPEKALAELAGAGIRVGKMQLTSGLKVVMPEATDLRETLARELEPFACSPYLHQVIARDRGGRRRQFPDLPQALAHLKDGSPGGEWRIHFHMPLFIEGFQGLATTQGETRAVLRLLREQKFTRHLEIETYTWDFLPPGLKVELLESLTREYLWVLEALRLPGNE